MNQRTIPAASSFYDELLSFERNPTKADCFIFFKAKRGEMAASSMLGKASLPTPFPPSVNAMDGPTENEFSVRTLVGLLMSDKITSKGLRLRGFKLKSGLDFRHLRTNSNLVFEDCDLLEGVDLRNGDFGNIKFLECKMSAFLAEYARIHGNLLLQDCQIGDFRDAGPQCGIRGAREHDISICRFDLRGAHVSGRVSVKDCKVYGANPEHLPLETSALFIRDLLSSISLNGITVNESLAISHCEILGEVSFNGAKIGEALSVRDCRIKRLKRPEEDFVEHSIFADAFRVGSQVHLENISSGDEGGVSTIRLKFGQVQGALLIKNVEFSKISPLALNAKDNHIGGRLNIIGKRAEKTPDEIWVDQRGSSGRFDLRRTSVAGDTSISGFNFEPAQKASIDLRDFQCEESLTLQRVTAVTPILLDRVKLNGRLRIWSVQIDIPFHANDDSQEHALSAREVRASEGVEISRKSVFSGHVMFDQSIVGKSFKIFNAEFSRYRGASAFSVRNSRIGDLFAVSVPDGGANGDATTKLLGGLDLSNSRCGSLFIARGTELSPPVDKRTALSLDNCNIDELFEFSARDFSAQERPIRISFRDMSCFEFRTDPKYWSEIGQIDASGFEYRRLGLGKSMSKSGVTALLKALGGAKFDPKIHRVMSEALTRKGHHSLATLVAKRKEKSRPVKGITDVPGALFNWLYGKFTGYGYSASRALIWLVGGISILAAASHAAWANGAIVPEQKVILQSDEWRTCVQTAPSHPSDCWLNTPGAGSHHGSFNAVIYSLDTIIPIVSLGHDENWSADTTMPAEPIVSIDLFQTKFAPKLGDLLWYLEILMIAFGWMLTASVATAFSRPRV